MAAGKRLQNIVEILAKKYEVEGKKAELTELRDPFQLGAWWILGQHAKKNGQLRAYEALRRAKGVTPGQLLDIAPEKLATICQIAGPYDDARAKELYAYADSIEEKCGQDFSKVFKGSVNEVRKFLEGDLMKARPFVDFLLLYGGKFNVFAVDIRVARVAARLGLAKLKSEKDFAKQYKDIQKALEAESQKDNDWIIRAHGLLHRHGAELCKASLPICWHCPLTADCPYFKKNPVSAPEQPERRSYTSIYVPNPAATAVEAKTPPTKKE